MTASMTGGGGSSLNNLLGVNGQSIYGSPFAVPSFLQGQPDPTNGGYPGVDARNAFIPTNPNQSGPSTFVSPFYNQLNNSGDPNYVPSPLNLTPGQRQTYLGQYNGLTNAGGGAPSNPGMDIYNGLLQQLANMQGPSTADLQSQANQQASLKYDPLIKQLQDNLSSAKTNEGQASQKVGDLYNSLGRAIAAQLPGITQQFSAQEDQSRQNYATLQDQIKNNYQGAQAAQAAELQKLGIQAALPQSTQKLQDDQQYLTGQAANNGQAINDAMRMMGQGQKDFMQRASAIAPTQGTNLQASLAQQLLNLQNSINQQIAGYQSQKGQAAASILSQLQNQASANYGKQQSDLIDQTMKLAQLENLTNPGIFGEKPKAPAEPSYKGISGVSKYFADNAGTNDPNALMKMFNDFENSNQLRQLTGPGGIGSPTLETAWPVLQQIATSEMPGIPNSALQELFNALAIKYGKY